MEKNTREISWQDVIRGFFVEKYEAELVSYLKGERKRLDDEYRKEKYFGNEEIESIFDPRNKEKENFLRESDFIESQLSKLQNFLAKPFALDLSETMHKIQDQRDSLNEKYSPQEWIAEAAENVKSVEFATHVSKLTHSRINSSSFIDRIESKKDAYLTSSTLKDKIIDGAVRGNQYSPIYQFLELELDNKKLAYEFYNLENRVLCEFAQDEEQLKEWNSAFAAILDQTKPSAHALLKQVYFPIDKESYHLLCNIVSSSLAQANHEYIRKDQRQLRKIKDKGKFASEIFYNFPKRASISVTASNHGNASQLNGKRGGRLSLFSCEPPLWKSSLKPPIYRGNFYYELSSNREVSLNLDYLRDFLLRFESIELSIKDPKRMKWIEKWVNNIIDEVFYYVSSIQALAGGWSDAPDIKLKKSHQFFLDIHRSDEEFILGRATSYWEDELISDFAAWLNNQLKGFKAKFTAQDYHSKIWEDIYEPELRYFLSLSKESFHREVH